MITTSDITEGAQFKTVTGIVWDIDRVCIDDVFGIAVYTSMEGCGTKGNYLDELNAVVEFLNEEQSVKL